MLDRDQVVRDTLAQLPPERLQRRIRATSEAHALLRDRLGDLDEAALRRVLELFNQDVSHGREVQGRFATGLVGRNANLLVGSLANVNEIVPALWRGDDAWLAANLVKLRRSGRLLGGGWLFLSMVLHARDPRRFVPRSSTMAQGLAALEGQPVLAFRSGADYLEYCRRVHVLLAVHGIDPHGADVLLVNGSRMTRAAGAAIDDDDDDELENPPVATPASSTPVAVAQDVVPSARGSSLTPVIAAAGETPAPASTSPLGSKIGILGLAAGPVATSPLESKIGILGLAADPVATSPLASVINAVEKVVSPAPVPPPARVDVREPVSAAPVTPGSFGWLHLTDLHQGMGGASWLWPNVRAQMFADLEKLHAQSGPWDLVFFTGDLTQRGAVEEFDHLDRTLEQLWARLEKFGSQPRLVAVPGNHDLARPQDAFDPVVLALQQWHDNRRLRDYVLGTPDNPYLARLRTAFAAYSAWVARRRWNQAPSVGGLLPGDVAQSLQVGGVRVGVVGLNSAFLQLTDGDFLEKLDVDPRQLHEVCGHDAPEWLGQHHINFLLTHHPPAWLIHRARQEFAAEIDTPGRFAAHFYGHMHEGTSTATSIGGASTRLTLQGASLFGLEEYVGRDGRRMQRIHGYSAGRVELADMTARLKVFPRRMSDGQAGRRIVRDENNYVLDDQGALAYHVPIKKPTR